jgi:hypothetical protein
MELNNWKSISLWLAFIRGEMTREIGLLNIVLVSLLFCLYGGLNIKPPAERYPARAGLAL